MGATIRSKTGRQFLRKLSARLSRLREKVDGVEVVAGFVKGKSSPESTYKAYVNEFGTMTTGILSSDKQSTIPSRPFMQQSIPKMRENISKVLVGTKARNLDTKLRNLGYTMADAIEKSAWDGSFVENAPYTIEKKGRDQPLIDTGDMVNDITSQVRRAQ